MLRLRGSETRIFGIRRIDKGLICYYHRQRIKVDVSSENPSSGALAKGERLKYHPPNLLTVVI